MFAWRRSAFRWECQGTYREPREQEPLRRFLAGDPDLTWFDGWLARVRDWVAAGKHIGRVRTLTDPLTDYLRFELFITGPAVEAGEDIRFITQDQAAELDMPTHDFWLFDDDRVCVLEIGDQGMSAVELITDPGKVGAYREWRWRAVEAAVPLGELHLST